MGYTGRGFFQYKSSVKSDHFCHSLITRFVGTYILYSNKELRKKINMFREAHFFCEQERHRERIVSAQKCAFKLAHLMLSIKLLCCHHYIGHFIWNMVPFLPVSVYIHLLSLVNLHLLKVVCLEPYICGFLPTAPLYLGKYLCLHSRLYIYSILSPTSTVIGEVCL
jgi:hypothetical protein